MIGIDYSNTAVALATTSCHATIGTGHSISFHALDFLQLLDVQAMFVEGSFDLIVDKGTLDAITLNPSTSDYTASPELGSMSRCQTLMQLYKDSLQYLLKKSSGRWMITSCNWTREELLSHFSGVPCLLYIFLYNLMSFPRL